ncbi:MAG: hypothetical protein VB876_10465 [Pirellulales bacterium]
MKFGLKRKKQDDDSAAAEDNSAPVAVKPVGGGAKEWLFLNAEKLVVGAVVLLLGYMVYSGIGTLKPNLQQTPQALELQAAQINQQVNEAKFPVDRYNVPPLDQTALQSLQPVPAASYGFKSLIGDIPLGEAGGKRGVPKIYPVRDLEALGGSGIFFVTEKFKDPAAAVEVGKGERKALPRELLTEMTQPPKDAEVEGRRWVAINALVSMDEQRSEHDLVFVGRPAYDADRDQPKFIIATIRRLEITSAAAGGEPDWGSQAKSWSLRARLDERRAAQQVWAIKADDQIELAHQRYVNSPLVDPLGPLGKSWKRWAIHSQIPLAPPKVKEPKKTNRNPTVRPVGGKKPDDKPAAKEDDPLGELLGPGETVKTEPEQPDVEKPQPADSKEEVKEKLVAFQLCRIFDFTVEPSKQYRYQIQLAAHNPNRGVEPRFLEEPKSTDAAYLTSDWSNSSNTVLVPADTEVFASSILPSDGDENPEPRVVVVCRKTDNAGGRAPTGRMELRRGEVVGGSLTTFEIDARSSAVIQRADSRIETDFTLLDFVGGQSVSENVSAPVRILVLDENGNLTVRDSATDRGEVSQFQSISGAGPVAPNPADQQQPKANPNGTADKPGGDGKDDENTDSLDLD